jgi:hypothetical protein
VYLLRRASLDAFPFIDRQMSKTFLQQADIQTGDWKHSDATLSASGATRDLAQVGGAGASKPVVGFPRECRER